MAEIGGNLVMNLLILVYHCHLHEDAMKIVTWIYISISVKVIVLLQQQIHSRLEGKGCFAIGGAIELTGKIPHCFFSEEWRNCSWYPSQCFSFKQHGKTPNKTIFITSLYAQIGSVQIGWNVFVK